MVAKKLFYEYEECFDRALINVESLLRGLTTNRSESFNAQISKVVGGKRIDYTLKSQYKSQCEIATLKHNSAESYAPI